MQPARHDNQMPNKAVSMTNLNDDFADRIHDELLGIKFFPSTQDDSSERLSAEALVRGYKKFCQRKQLRVRDPVVSRIRNVCHHLLFDLRELDLSSQEFEAIMHILQVSLSIGN
ncbi:hypothetical protein P879_06507 [Paragonimus westermani]|uniref:Uncharacterized protein n=1 Tax=Paragonimus westermani TaxID=34504 RepID=A0A8T0D462_9TREM|nr:hypothetical protein P879_06507 [Paragonimus westermani]